MYNIEKAHFIVQEMIMDGYVLDANKTNVLSAVLLLDKAVK